MPRSTFSIDVDAAAYTRIREMILRNRKPYASDVRIEEMLNYFRYDYPAPAAEHPFSITTDVAACPWNSGHSLALIGLQGRSVTIGAIPPCNLVFLIDVSGSMADAGKLDLLKRSFRFLVDSLRDEDLISVVVYAGAAGLVLPPTRGSDRQTILNAIDTLRPGGTTAGGRGILLAYEVARAAYIKGGNNRVILATDGDFNVGVSNKADLLDLIEEKRREHVFLTALGVGVTHFRDDVLELLADHGNGAYYYLDSDAEGKRVFGTELTSSIYTIAKDVKLQVEFNPDLVLAYRLIGYENRRLANEEFANDEMDAGDLGPGHSVTALYEIVPTDASRGVRPDLIVKGTDRERHTYQSADFGNASFRPAELLSVKLRYKLPDESSSRLVTGPAIASQQRIDDASESLRFAAAVAEWGLILRNSVHRGDASVENVLTLARSAIGTDIDGRRTEFVRLVDMSFR